MGLLLLFGDCGFEWFCVAAGMFECLEWFHLGGWRICFGFKRRF